MPQINKKTNKVSTAGRQPKTQITQEPKKTNNFYGFFVEEIQDLYSAENQILQELPKMMRAASSDELKEALNQHYKKTQDQVERLEQIFFILGVKEKERSCIGLCGIFKEGQELLTRPQTTAKDVAIIAATQKAEHYEIAAYGTAKIHAKCLELAEIANLLNETLDEKSATNKDFTKMAEGALLSTK
jgi:ferritin-like metal-binding protein YciE